MRVRVQSGIRMNLVYMTSYHLPPRVCVCATASDLGPLRVACVYIRSESVGLRELASVRDALQMDYRHPYQRTDFAS